MTFFYLFVHTFHLDFVSDDTATKDYCHRVPMCHRGHNLTKQGILYGTMDIAGNGNNFILVSFCTRFLIGGFRKRERLEGTFTFGRILKVFFLSEMQLGCHIRPIVCWLTASHIVLAENYWRLLVTCVFIEQKVDPSSESSD